MTVHFGSWCFWLNKRNVQISYYTWYQDESHTKHADHKTTGLLKAGYRRHDCIDINFIDYNIMFYICNNICIYMSYWFIIGTAPPVHVFMWIHVNTRVLPVVTSLERVWHELYWARQKWYSFTGTCRHVKRRDFTVIVCRHTKFVHRIRWIHVNWASWTREFTYRTCEITGHCLLG